MASTNNNQQPRYAIEGQKKGKNVWGGISLFWFKETAKDKNELDLMIELIKEDTSIDNAFYLDMTKNLHIHTKIK